MKIFIIRHGESLDDIEDRYGGFANYPLTDKGKNQAKELAKTLKDKNITKIYSSPYLRAWDTAEILSKELNIPIEVNKNIRERNTYGYLSGMRKDFAKKLFEKDCEKVNDPILANEVDGTEKSDEVVERLNLFISSLSIKNETIALIMHGKVIDILMRYIFKFPNVYKPSETGYIVVDYSEVPKVLETVNVEIK